MDICKHYSLLHAFFEQNWLVSELRGKRPLFGADLPMTDEVKDVLDTLRVVAELPSDCFGAYVISMATSSSDVLVVELLQRECQVPKPLRVVPLFEKLADLEFAAASLTRLFSVDWYLQRINGKQEVFDQSLNYLHVSNGFVTYLMYMNINYKDKVV